MGPPRYHGVGGRVEERQMLFDEKTRNACWRKAALLLGRNPERWRHDAAGNAVTRALWGMDGLHGYMYDHIVPISRDKQLDGLERSVYGDVSCPRKPTDSVPAGKPEKTSKHV